MKILFVIGSLKKKSTNRMLAEIVEGIIADRAKVSYLEYTDLPMINPDIEFPVPESVQRVREEVVSADGVWMFFPEYNHSYPGVLKNMLDWISRPIAKDAPRTSSVSSGVPVTYSSISGKGGAVKAFEKMADLMEKIHMKEMPGEKLALSEPEIKGETIILTPEERAVLNRQTEAFLNWIQETENRPLSPGEGRLE